LPLIGVVTLFDEVPFENDAIRQWTVLIAFILLLVIALTWLLKTDFGLSMRATGNNEQMVRALGVNTEGMKIIGLSLANMLTAMSGYLMVQQQGFADINMGIGIVISGLAAVMIGEAFARLFRQNKILVQILMVVAGSILFRVILAFTLSMGLNPNYLKLVTALIVLIVISFTRFRKTAS